MYATWSASCRSIAAVLQRSTSLHPVWPDVADAAGRCRGTSWTLIQQEESGRQEGLRREPLVNHRLPLNIIFSSDNLAECWAINGRSHHVVFCHFLLVFNSYSCLPFFFSSLASRVSDTREAQSSYSSARCFTAFIMGKRLSSVNL